MRVCDYSSRDSISGVMTSRCSIIGMNCSHFFSWFQVMEEWQWLKNIVDKTRASLVSKNASCKRQYFVHHSLKKENLDQPPRYGYVRYRFSAFSAILVFYGAVSEMFWYVPLHQGLQNIFHYCLVGEYSCLLFIVMLASSLVNH